MATAMGALGGFGSSFGRAIFFGAAANMLNNAYQQADDPCRESMDTGQILRSGLYGDGGGSIGYLGGMIGRNIFRTESVIGKEIGHMPEFNYRASGTAIGAAAGGYYANQ